MDISTQAQTQLGMPSSVVLNGRIAYENAWSYSSVLSGAPQKAEIEYIKPEGIKAYEIGYRGKASILNIDLSAYFNQYDGFIVNKTVLVPLYGQVSNNYSNPLTQLALFALDPDSNPTTFDGDFQAFQVYTNSLAEISSFRGSIGLSTKIDRFNIGANYTYAKFNFDQTTDPDYDARFNTPEHKAKLSFGSEELFKNVGFGLNYRYQTEFLWQSNFVDALVPTRSVFDAQVSLKVPSFKSIFKVGGTNIGGEDYVVAPGTGKIGSQYYVSWTINP